MAAKQKYDERFVKIAKVLCMRGGTDEELADAFEVSPRTINRWKTGRVFFTPDCESVLEAISMAVWNPKNMELERLDDGTSDIDSLDAMEYSFEKRIKKFIKKTG